MAIDTVTQHIVATPGVLGGKPRIAGHRISVQDVAIWHERMGKSVDEIATEYGLTLGEVYAALSYYHDHREEIDASIRTGAAFVEELCQRYPSKLSSAAVHESMCNPTIPNF
jgi:uncharacterized protein (DUF433 family)